jgi:hypothetical protein
MVQGGDGRGQDYGFLAALGMTRGGVFQLEIDNWQLEIN